MQIYTNARIHEVMHHEVITVQKYGKGIVHIEIISVMIDMLWINLLPEEVKNKKKTTKN